ncbi:MAG: recombinase RecT [Muribaculaceae bacterium]|nr:recombinase RecT [Muribaculaceae bacterium]
MSNLQLTVEEINKLSPLDIVEHPIVRERFTQVYETLWGNGEAAYQRESIYFNKALRDNDNGKLQKATPFSIFTAFIDLAVCGLSLEPGTRALAYLIGRNVNIGSRDQPRWEGRCVLTVSAYGELVMRTRAGQIRHADNPVLVYDNDEFSFKDVDGRKSVSYTCNMPHTGHNIVACYLRITRADGSIDYSVMFPEDWVRLAGYSMKQNRSKTNPNGKANDLYGMDANGVVHIDPGFLMAKCIKHAFKSYPKVRIGRGTELQSQQVDEQPQLSDEDIYGVGNVDMETGEVLDQPQPAPQPFGNNEPPQGVTVETDDEEGF